MQRARPSLVVGIAGGTGSGKSWLAHHLQRELAGQTAVVPLDWYYRDQSGLDPAREAELNFDHPDAIDSALLIAQLDILRGGEPVDAPRYDYRTHARVAGQPLAPAPVIVLEGILVLHYPAVRERLDRAVFVETPADVRLERRLHRDAAERGIPPEETRRLYQTFARPMHEQFVQPSARWADHVWHSQEDADYPARLVAEITERLS